MALSFRFYGVVEFKWSSLTNGLLSRRTVLHSIALHSIACKGRKLESKKPILVLGSGEMKLLDFVEPNTITGAGFLGRFRLCD
jgi:hypothetical protein